MHKLLTGLLLAISIWAISASAALKPLTLGPLTQKRLLADQEFIVPAKGDTISYFYGPRLFSSFGKAEDLEKISQKIIDYTTQKKSIKTTHINMSETAHQMHSGVDFSMPSGNDVMAVADGVVLFAGFNQCTGNTLVLQHEKNKETIYSIYAHLQEFQKVQIKNDQQWLREKFSTKKEKSMGLAKGLKERNLMAGDQVMQGQLIALSGQTGSALSISGGQKEGCISGPHLHFEMRIPADGGRVPFAPANSYGGFHVATKGVNPADYIPEIDYLCRVRKGSEVLNALQMRRNLIKAQQEKAKQLKKPFSKMPKIYLNAPISAGLCSQEYETYLKHHITHDLKEEPLY